MVSLPAMYYNVTLYADDDRCYPGCNPDSDCNPCNPCGPDTVCNPRNSSDEEMGCYPCSPCNPDAECSPCNPCNPDSRCYPCSPCRPDMLDESDNDNNGDSGCFLTSACVEALGLPDDCEELQVLRVLRDKRKLYDDAFASLVHEYYIIAPKIVKAIDSMPECNAIYHDIYYSLVKPCVAFVKQNQENEAIKLYTDIVLKLTKIYLEGT